MSTNFEYNAECDSEFWTIHLAGDYNTAIEAIREFAFYEGFCAQVQKCTYVYTGGVEEGVTVRVIRYPRFKKPIDEIVEQVERLAQVLANKLCQKSYTIENSNSTVYFTSDNPLHKK